MNRPVLAEDSGMLFDLRPIKEPVSMWMKDTKISLDMIFIDKDGSIFWIYENAEPMSTTLILPPYNPAAVLEVNAGDAKKYNIRVGDVIKYKWFANAAPVKAVASEPVAEAATEALTNETQAEQTAPAEPEIMTE